MRSDTGEPTGGSRGFGDLYDDGRVDRRAYLSAEVFDAEVDRIFGTSWVFVAHESQVPRPGDFATTTLGRSPVIVARGDDDVVRVLHNRCSHHAATVCQVPCGNATVFRCQYHGWTFSNSGELSGMTYPSGYDAADRADVDLGLQPVARVASYRGFIFASLAAEGPTLDEHLGNVKEFMDLRINAAPTGLSLVSGRHRYAYPFNWKIQCENVVDGYHANFVHQSALSVLGRKPDGTISSRIFKLAHGDSPSEALGLGNGHSVLDQRRALGETAIRVAKTRPGGQQYWDAVVASLGVEQATQAVMAGSGEGLNVFVFPNLAFVSQQIRVIHPIAVGRTHVDLYPTWLEGAPEAFNTDRLRMHELTYGPAGLIGPDDLEMFEHVARGLQGDGATVDFRHGHASEVVDNQGISRGQFTTEAPQRSFWNHWRDVMTTGSPR